MAAAIFFGLLFVGTMIGFHARALRMLALAVLASTNDRARLAVLGEILPSPDNE